jgi:hybrid cluster-associated redox disulfide protein
MTTEGSSLQADSLVDDVMRAWPSTIRVFLDFHMNCVGCPIGPFHTVSDSCQAYGITMEDFLTALQKARAA